jgi:hypothetical protein
MPQPLLAGREAASLHLTHSSSKRCCTSSGNPPVLEVVQNVWSHSTVNPEEFVRYLGPQSKLWWQGLNKFWSGNAPLVEPPNASDA